MAEENKVLIEIDLETGKFESGIKKTNDSLGDLGEKGKGAFHAMGEAALGFNAILELGMKAFEFSKEILKETIVESVKSAMDLERSVSSLNLAVSNSSYSSKDASHEMLEFAEAISKTSTFNASFVMQLEATAVNMTKTEDAAKKVTKAAIELSAATGRDAQSSMMLLSMSMEGVVGRGLDKLIPGVKSLSEAQLRAGAATDLIIAKFGGSALAQTKTFTGRIQVLKNTWDDLHESMGKAITQSPIVNRALEGITLIIQKVTDIVDGWIKGGGIEKMFASFLEIGNAITTYIVAPLELLSNIASSTWDGMVLGADVLIEAFLHLGNIIAQSTVGVLKESLTGISELVGLFSKDLGDKMKAGLEGSLGVVTRTTQMMAESASEVTEDQLKKTESTMNKIFDFPVSEKMSKMMETTKEFLSKATKPMDEFKDKKNGMISDMRGVGGAFKDIWSGMKQEAEDKVKDFHKIFSEVGKSMMNGIGNGAGKAFSSFGRALAQGKDGLKAFTESFIASIGEMAVQLGTKFILEGTAYLFVPGMNAMAAPLISAGAALAAFGGALGAVGGGGGGGGGSDLASSGPATGVASPAASPAQKADQGPQKHASIVINGDFLNSRETANHLAEVLRQNSDITDYSITAQGRSYA